MPNIKSAKKSIKTSAKSYEGNRAVKSRMVSARRKLYESIGSDPVASKEAYSSYCSVLDKAVKRGALKANNANRRKSRACIRMRKAEAA